MGGRCYFVSNPKPAASWHKARRACRASGGDLAVPTSHATNRHIYNLLKTRKIGMAYIGLYRVQENVAKNTFYTVLCVKATFTYWIEREPNNPKREGCTELVYRAPYYHGADKRGRWNDVSCGARLHYVCQRSFLRN